MKEGNPPMKNEIRAEALNAVLPKVMEMFPDAVNVCVSNKNMLAIDTGKVDDNGNPIYATIDVTIKDNEATKTREGFDLMTAVNAYNEKMANATERKSKASTSTPKNTEAAERKTKRMTALREWWNTEAVSGEGYTSTDVKNAMPDVYGELLIMQVGSDLKTLSEEMPTDCEMRMVEGKKHYFKA